MVGGTDAPQLYLVCELGDPYRFIVCLVQGPGVFDECSRVGTVEMERDGVDLSSKVQLLLTSCGDRNPYRTIGTPFDKVFHPIKSRLIVCARWRDKIVSLRFERVYILLPQ